MNARARFGCFLALVASGAIYVMACAKDSGTTDGNSGSTSASTATATTESVAPSQAGATTGFGVPLSANKCPSAVAGSTTTVKELPDGIEITVTAPGGPPINDIRQRGVQIVAAAVDPSTGAGSAADGLAKCPIVVKDATVTETDVPGGATFTVKPSKSANLAALSKEVKARASGYVPETAK